MRAISSLGVGIVCLACVGCSYAPGRPAPGPEVPRPEQLMDSATLYKQSCAGCHGLDGKNGGAPALANPVFLAVIGQETVRKIAANGVAGTLMPAFDKSMGGTLTAQQLDSLVQGIFRAWGRPGIDGAPPYAATLKGDPGQGNKNFATFCEACHGVDGKGVPHAIGGSIADPAFLALVSDQRLRITIIAGRPDLGMPDWRSHFVKGAGKRVMTDQEITDIVAWLAAQRTAYPGQPYAP
jgi:mono/diheme cytochrome c family protein